MSGVRRLQCSMGLQNRKGSGGAWSEAKALGQPEKMGEGDKDKKGEPVWAMTRGSAVAVNGWIVPTTVGEHTIT